MRPISPDTRMANGLDVERIARGDIQLRERKMDDLVREERDDDPFNEILIVVGP